MFYPANNNIIKTIAVIILCATIAGGIVGVVGMSNLARQRQECLFRRDDASGANVLMQTRLRCLRQLPEMLWRLISLKTFYSSPSSGAIKSPAIIAAIVLKYITSLRGIENFAKKSEAYPAPTEIITNSPKRFAKNDLLPSVQNVFFSTDKFIPCLPSFVKRIFISGQSTQNLRQTIEGRASGAVDVQKELVKGGQNDAPAAGTTRAGSTGSIEQIQVLVNNDDAADVFPEQMSPLDIVTGPLHEHLKILPETTGVRLIIFPRQQAEQKEWMDIGLKPLLSIEALRQHLKPENVEWIHRTTENKKDCLHIVFSVPLILSLLPDSPALSDVYLIPSNPQTISLDDRREFSQDFRKNAAAFEDLQTFLSQIAGYVGTKLMPATLPLGLPTDDDKDGFLQITDLMPRIMSEEGVDALNKAPVQARAENQDIDAVRQRKAEIIDDFNRKLEERKQQLQARIRQIEPYIQPDASAALYSNIMQLGPKNSEIENLLSDKFNLHHAQSSLQRMMAEIDRASRKIQHKIEDQMAQPLSGEALEPALNNLVTNFPDELNDVSLSHEETISKYTEIFQDKRVQEKGWTVARLAQFLTVFHQIGEDVRRHLPDFPWYSYLVLDRNLDMPRVVYAYARFTNAGRRSVSVENIFFLNLLSHEADIKDVFRRIYYFIYSNLGGTIPMMDPALLSRQISPSKTPASEPIEGKRGRVWEFPDKVTIPEPLQDPKNKIKRMIEGFEGHPWLQGPHLPQAEIMQPLSYFIWSFSPEAPYVGFVADELLRLAIIWQLANTEGGEVLEAVTASLLELIETGVKSTRDVVWGKAPAAAREAEAELRRCKSELEQGYGLSEAEKQHFIEIFNDMKKRQLTNNIMLSELVKLLALCSVLGDSSNAISENSIRNIAEEIIKDNELVNRIMLAGLPSEGEGLPESVQRLRSELSITDPQDVQKAYYGTVEHFKTILRELRVSSSSGTAASAGGQQTTAEMNGTADVAERDRQITEKIRGVLSEYPDRYAALVEWHKREQEASRRTVVIVDSSGENSATYRILKSMPFRKVIVVTTLAEASEIPADMIIINIVVSDEEIKSVLGEIRFDKIKRFGMRGFENLSENEIRARMTAWIDA